MNKNQLQELIDGPHNNNNKIYACFRCCPAQTSIAPGHNPCVLISDVEPALPCPIDPENKRASWWQISKKKPLKDKKYKLTPIGLPNLKLV